MGANSLWEQILSFKSSPFGEDIYITGMVLGMVLGEQV